MAPSGDADASQREKGDEERATQEQKQKQQKQKQQTTACAPFLPPPSLVAIDDLLDAAAAALPAGGLLHGPLFSLHDAMLAVEVGDPKLDAGARGHGNDEDGGDGDGGDVDGKSRATSVAASAATARLLLQTPTPPLLSPSEALAVLDGLVLAAEAAWHAGGCLETTIGTCVFMLRPRLLEKQGKGGGGGGGGEGKRSDDNDNSGGGKDDDGGDNDNNSLLLLLRALTLATRASVSVTRSLVTRAGVSEDEDFQLFQQALPSMLEEKEEGGENEGDGDKAEKIDELLKRAEEMLLSSSSSSSSSSSCSPSSSSSPAAAAAAAAAALLGLSAPPTREEAEALSRRLRFRRATLRALRSAEALGGKRGGKGEKGKNRRRRRGSCSSSSSCCSSSSAASSSPFSDLASSVSEALEALDEIEKEPKKEKEEEEEENDKGKKKGDAAALPLLPLPWFDAAAARRELPPAPPRPDRQFDVEQGRKSWRKLLEDLSAVAGFPESVEREEGGGGSDEEDEEVTTQGRQREQRQQKQKRRRYYHLRGALREVRRFSLREAGAVPRSALALVLGLALDAGPAAAVENSGGDEEKNDGDGEKDDGGDKGDDDDDDASSFDSSDDDDGSFDDNPYISEGSVMDSLHLPRDDPLLFPRPPSRPSSSSSQGGEETSSKTPQQPPTPTSMASKFVEQATLGLQGWCVASLLNPARSRRRHRRCCEDWGHVHQHALNAEADQAFCEWLEGEGGGGSGGGGGEGGGEEEDDESGNERRRQQRWDWRLPASSSAASSSSSSAIPNPSLSPVDAAVTDHASPLSCWVEEQACRAQRDHLLSGFALDCYAPREAAAVLLFAEHLERRGEGAAGALAERYPPSVVVAAAAVEEKDGKEALEKTPDKKKKKKSKQQKASSAAASASSSSSTAKAAASPPPPPAPPAPRRLVTLPHPNALEAERDSRACAARKYVAGALLRAAAATMAESVANPVATSSSPSSPPSSSSNEKKKKKKNQPNFAFAPRVPRAPEPFNSPRDGFDARFSGGPLSRLTTPPQLSFDDYGLVVGEALRAVSENNGERFFGGGGGGAGGGGGRDGDGDGDKGDGNDNDNNKITALFLLRLAKDACLLARRALPSLACASPAAPPGSPPPPPPTGKWKKKKRRALSVEEEGALSRVLGMTAVSLGVLEKEEAEAEERMRRWNGKDDDLVPFEPSRLVVSWDASIHPLYPALKVKRK